MPIRIAAKQLYDLAINQAGLLRANASKIGPPAATDRPRKALLDEAARFEGRRQVPLDDLNKQRKYWGDKANFGGPDSDANMIRKDMHGALNDVVEGELLGLLDGALHTLDLGPEHVGTSFLGCVVEIGQHVAQQLELLLLALGQVVRRHQLEPLHRL